MVSSSGELRASRLGAWTLSLVFGAGGALSMYAVTMPVVRAARAGLPLPAGWTWTRLVAFDVAALALFGHLVWTARVGFGRALTREGGRQPGLRGAVLLRWAGVDRMASPRRGWRT